MSSNRLIYDSCAYDQKLGDNKNIFNYDMLISKYESCAKCVDKDEVDMQRLPSRVDLESELRIYPNRLTNCSNKKYIPCNLKKEGGCKMQKHITHRLCDRDMLNTFNIPRFYNNIWKVDTNVCNKK